MAQLLRRSAALGRLKNIRNVRPLSSAVPEDGGETLAARFSELTDLADDRLGSKILFATDEWFATADNMLKPQPPHFDPETFCTQGKVMDGWESRRRRLAGHDWAIVKLGLSGFVHGLELDTAHFTGNQVPAASVYAACIETDDDASWLGPPRATLGVQGTCATPEEIAESRARVEAAAEWTELLPIVPLRAGYTEDRRHGEAEGYSVHRFAVPPSAATKRVTHLLVNQHPDGGLARMRAWGVVSRNYESELAASAVGSIDLLSALNGGRAVGCSNRHYGEPRNLLRPGRGHRMDDGWETARNPRRPHAIVKDPETGLVHMPGAFDWSVLRLAAVAGKISSVEIDTAHFRGNYPESVLVEAANAPHSASSALLNPGDDSVEWSTLLPRTTLGPDAIHTFDLADLAERAAERTTHLRVTIFPDGGIMRVRAFGEAVEAMPTEEADTGSGGSGGGGGGGAGGASGGAGGSSGAGVSGAGGSGGGMTASGASAGAGGVSARAGGGSEGVASRLASVSHEFRASDGASADAEASAVDAALSWSTKQSLILTGGGVATDVFSSARGYPHKEEELPHHHLVNGTTRETFRKWAGEVKAAAQAGDAATKPSPPSWLVGAWSRPVFEGGGLSSTDAEETCFNLVTSGAFVDVRIPTSRDVLLGDKSWDTVSAAVADGAARPLASLSDLEVSSEQSSECARPSAP